jgi:hypothetical protein
MEGSQFDRVTKQLATQTGRRRMLQGLAVVVATLGVALGHQPATAKPHRHRAQQVHGQGNGPRPGRCGQFGHPCKFTKQCCEAAGLVCIDGACGCNKGETNCGGRCVTCPTGDTTCSGTTCVCTGGETECGGKCVTCPTGGECAGTSCVCTGGQTECSGKCVNTQNDEHNCGACGTRCTVNEECVAGKCACGSDDSCSTGTFGAGSSCCQGLGGLVCGCSFAFLNLSTCDASFNPCPAGTTPCTATTINCGREPAQVCCPSGSTCSSEGTCLIG